MARRLLHKRAGALERPSRSADEALRAVERSPAMHVLAVVIGLVLSIAIGPAIALAQMPGPGSMPGMAPEPSMAPADRARSAVPASTVRVVKRVDPAESTITVGSGLFGLFGRTVDVTGDTTIQVEGRKGTLADVREGQRAKVSYELRAGRNVATHIEVIPAERSTDRR